MTEPGRFEHYETLAQEIGWLKLYQEAQTIEVKDNDTKAALQAILDQLPEDYRDVAGLKQKIADYDAAVAAAAAAAAEAERKAEEEQAKQAEVSRILSMLVGRWRAQAGWELVYKADGTFIEYDGYGNIGRIGTYYVSPSKYNGEECYVIGHNVTPEDQQKYGGAGIGFWIKEITSTTLVTYTFRASKIS